MENEVKLTLRSAELSATISKKIHNVGLYITFKMINYIFQHEKIFAINNHDVYQANYE